MTAAKASAARRKDAWKRLPHEVDYYDDDDAANVVLALTPKLIKGVRLYTSVVVARFEALGAAQMDVLYNVYNADIELFIAPQLQRALRDEDVVNKDYEFNSSDDEADAMRRAAARNEAAELKSQQQTRSAMALGGNAGADHGGGRGGGAPDGAAALGDDGGDGIAAGGGNGKRAQQQQQQGTGCYLVDLMAHLTTAGSSHHMDLSLGTAFVDVMCHVALNSLARSIADGRVVVDDTFQIPFDIAHLDQLFRRCIVIVNPTKLSALASAAESGGLTLMQRALIATPVAHVRDVLVANGASSMVCSLIGMAGRELAKHSAEEFQPSHHEPALRLLASVGYLGQWLLYDANPKVQADFQVAFSALDRRPIFDNVLNLAIEQTPAELRSSGFLSRCARLMQYLSLMEGARKNLMTERPDLVGIYSQRVSSTKDSGGAAGGKSSAALFLGGESRRRPGTSAAAKRGRRSSGGAADGGAGALGATTPGDGDDAASVASSQSRHSGGKPAAAAAAAAAAGDGGGKAPAALPDAAPAQGAGGGKGLPGSPNSRGPKVFGAIGDGVAHIGSNIARRIPGRLRRGAGSRMVTEGGVADNERWEKASEMQKARARLYFARWRIVPTLTTTLAQLVTADVTIQAATRSLASFLQLTAENNNINVKRCLWKRNLQSVLVGRYPGAAGMPGGPGGPGGLDGGDGDGDGDADRKADGDGDGDGDDRGSAGGDGGSSVHSGGSDGEGDDGDDGEGVKADFDAAAKAAVDDVDEPSVINELINLAGSITKLMMGNTRAYSHMYGSFRLFSSLSQGKRGDIEQLRGVVEAIHELVQGSRHLVAVSDGGDGGVGGAADARLDEDTVAAVRAAARRAALELRRTTALNVWAMCMQCFDYITEEEGVQERVLKSASAAAAAALKANTPYKLQVKPWRDDVAMVRGGIMALERSVVELCRLTLTELLDEEPYEDPNRPAADAIASAIVRGNKQALLASVYHKDRLERLLGRLKRHYTASRRADRFTFLSLRDQFRNRGKRKGDGTRGGVGNGRGGHGGSGSGDGGRRGGPGTGGAAGMHSSHMREMDKHGRVKGSNTYYGYNDRTGGSGGGGASTGGVGVGAAAASGGQRHNARYGFGGGEKLDRDVLDQLVFHYYQLLAGLAPRLLQRRFPPKDLERIKAHVGNIEIVREGDLEAVTFPTPLAVRNAVNNDAVKWAVRNLKRSEEISRDFHVNKLRDFVRVSDSVINVVKVQSELLKLGQLSAAMESCGSCLSATSARAQYLVATGEKWWYYGAMLLAMAINAIILVFGRADKEFHVEGSTRSGDGWAWLREVQDWDDDAHVHGIMLRAPYAFVLRLMAATHLLLAVLLFISYVAVPGRVFLAKARKEQLVRVRESTGSFFDTTMVVEQFNQATRLGNVLHRFKLLVHVPFLAQLGYLVMSVAGNIISPVFFAIELFALTKRVPIFNEVLWSVVKNPTRLLSTIVLAIIVLWVYVLIGVHAFYGPDGMEYSFPDNEFQGYCDTLASCFRYHILFGSGSPPLFTELNNAKLAFAFSYNVFIVWVIVAIVAGIIIDNLGELRDLRSAIADDLERRCFICNIERSMFEDVDEDGFTRHVRNEHNIWSYIAFLMHLETTDEFEYTPSEKYVADKLHERGVSGSRWYSFFPARMALALRKSKRTKNALVSSFTDLASRVDALEDSLKKDNAVTRRLLKEIKDAVVKK